jgi:hypothetical protein
MVDIIERTLDIRLEHPKFTAPLMAFLGKDADGLGHFEGLPPRAKSSLQDVVWFDLVNDSRDNGKI